jgi:pre-rRNA-processing protein TSR3
MQNDAKDYPKLHYIIITKDDKVEKKCTLHPFRGRSDFSFRTKRDPGEFLAHSILLFPKGEPLTTELAGKIISEATKTNSKADVQKHSIAPVLEISLIDSTWKKAKGIYDALPQIKEISLQGYVTGAIRNRPPPIGGLASVEALFLTSLLLGRCDLSLLEHYHFKDRFLKLNKIELLDEHA